MDQVEQPIVLMFLFLKDLEHKETHRELCSVLGECIELLSQTKWWICSFKDGDLYMKTKVGQGDSP
jgi:hypothetical protein